MVVEVVEVVVVVVVVVVVLVVVVLASGCTLLQNFRMKNCQKIRHPNWLWLLVQQFQAPRRTLISRRYKNHKFLLQPQTGFCMQVEFHRTDSSAISRLLIVSYYL